MLDLNIYNKYLAIDLLTRYKSISNTYNSKDVLEAFDKEEFLKFLKKLNCRFSFNPKESFFGLSEQEGNFDFKFNLSLKYGMVEPILWGKNVCTDDQFGGALIRVTKLIQLTSGSNNIEKIMYPRFKSYEDLIKITQELFDLYNDFKRVILSNED